MWTFFYFEEIYEITFERSLKYNKCLELLWSMKIKFLIPSYFVDNRNIYDVNIHRSF